MKMAGPLHPPFSLFLVRKKKRKRAVHGPKEKKKYWGNDEGTGDGGPRLNERRSRNDYPRVIGFGGGLFFDEWTSCSFRCRCPGVGWAAAYGAAFGQEESSEFPCQVGSSVTPKR